MESYIEQVNRFWKVQQIECLSSSEAYLYFFLLNECNIQGWLTSFTCPLRKILLSTNLPKKKILDARNKLMQVGLITFEEQEKQTFYHLV